MSETSFYSRHWDHYVDTWERWRDKEGEDWRWPGDEWGNPDVWESNYRRFFVGADSWGKAVEIGQGSGKYTVRVLDGNGKVALRAYDVSPKFLEVCAGRCKDHVASGRLSLRQIDVTTPRFLLDDLQDWKREVDALYSIGVLVHVDLQYLVPYLLAAGTVLKPGGKLIAGFGNVGSEAGFHRLLADVNPFWKGQLNPDQTGKYEWLSGCLVESLLPRLGFQVDELDAPEDSINVTTVATLVEPERAERLAENYLSS